VCPADLALVFTYSGKRPTLGESLGTVCVVSPCGLRTRGQAETFAHTRKRWSLGDSLGTVCAVVPWVCVPKKSCFAYTSLRCSLGDILRIVCAPTFGPMGLEQSSAREAPSRGAGCEYLFRGNPRSLNRVDRRGLLHIRRKP